MPRANDEAAEALEEYADLYALSGGDAFRVRSYRKAAKAIRGSTHDIAVGDVRAVPGVGQAIASKVEGLLAHGTFPQLEKLRDQVPEGVRALTRVPSLGPKTAVTLYREYGIDSPEALGEALREGRLDRAKGLGAKTRANLLKGVDAVSAQRGRVHIGVAMNLADAVVRSLRPGAERVSIAGSLRRMKDLIGGIDVLAVADESLLEMVLRQPYATEVISAESHKVAVRTRDGIQVDVRLVPAQAWGAALQCFTGSEDHNTELRRLAMEQGYTLSEHGLFAGDEPLPSFDEAEIYAQLGLQFIPPTMREGRGEVAAARRGELPMVIEVADLLGDLHSHTDLTDGVASLGEMVAAAADRGYEYFAVTDHAPDLVMQRMTLEKAKAQRDELKLMQDGYPDMVLLHGTELNIGPDGAVDWPEEVLREFDVCVASVHSHFAQDRDDMTRRFITACENPEVNVIGHPSTRKIGKRGPVDADWDEVFKAAARTGTAMEIDSFPDRSDLPDDLVRSAKYHGVKFAVDSDAHAVADLDFQRFGVGIAQRAWLTADDVVNTWPYERLCRFLSGRRR
ncbi:MAG TPA: DNA polymerase/3'-5' exonuclease PolX [Candidatus Stackebrandtia excrementipullorum]|nr:DNA polymerase/3'-5' exonuclease PolX [Candidatus Stackebrandtia excrementipullorum]